MDECVENRVRETCKVVTTKIGSQYTESGKHLMDAAVRDREDSLGHLPRSKRFEKIRYSQRQRHRSAGGLVV